MTDNRIYKIQYGILYQGTRGCDCGKRSRCSGMCDLVHRLGDRASNWKRYRDKQYKDINKTK